MKKTLVLGTATAAAVLLTGCSMISRQTKYGVITPDEIEANRTAVETMTETERGEDEPVPLVYGPAPFDNSRDDEAIPDVYGPAVPAGRI